MRWIVSGGAVLLLATAAGAAAQPVFRAGVDIVHFNVLVQDRKGTSLSELAAEDFEVYEDGVRQTIAYFARGVPEDGRLPLHTGLLFDTSTSMEKDLEMARTAAVKFLNALPRAIDMTLVDFDTEVRIARFSQADFPRLVERIRSRKPFGATALYDALGVYLDGAAFQDGQKILVMYTDGGDTYSNQTFGDTLDLVKASDVTIYAIGLTQNQSSSGRAELQLRLQQVADQSGGRAFFPTSIEQIEKAYDDIVAELHTRYVIGYGSTNSQADGEWRKVEIRLRDRLDLKDARVRSRKGYFALFRAPSR